MDLLGSIMNSMDKPPSLSEKEKLLRKSTFILCPFLNISKVYYYSLARKEEIEKKQNAEKENYKRFKEKVEDKLRTYFNDDQNANLKFSPMDHIYRSIVYVLSTMSFNRS